MVHAEQHLGEVLRVGPADVGLQRDDCVTLVVLAAEECFLLESLELLSQRSERVGDLLLHPAVHREELPRVFEVACELVVALELARDARVLGGDLRRALLVVPEAGLAHPGL